MKSKKPHANRLQVAITNPFYYRKVIELIRKTKANAIFNQALRDDALEREKSAYDQLVMMTEKCKVIQAAYNEVMKDKASLRMELAAKPVGGKHSELVIDLCNNIASDHYRYVNRNYGPDEIECRHCEYSEKQYDGRYRGLDIDKHKEDCSYINALAILRSQPED